MNTPRIAPEPLPVDQICVPSLLTAPRTLFALNVVVPNVVDVSTLPLAKISAAPRWIAVDAVDATPAVPAAAE